MIVTAMMTTARAMTPIGMKTGDDEEYNNGDNDDYEMEGEGWNNPYFLPKYCRQLINILYLMSASYI